MSEARKITLEFPSLRAFLAEYGARISTEGMLLRTDSPPEEGSRVEVEVALADGIRLLRVSGETLWSGASGGEIGAAVRFDELDDTSRKLIGKIVDQRRRGGAAPFELPAVPRGARLRDLTVPAVPAAGEAAAPGSAGEGAIFDLGAPPPPAVLGGAAGEAGADRPTVGPPPEFALEVPPSAEPAAPVELEPAAPIEVPEEPVETAEERPPSAAAEPRMESPAESPQPPAAEMPDPGAWPPLTEEAPAPELPAVDLEIDSGDLALPVAEPEPPAEPVGELTEELFDLGEPAPSAAPVSAGPPAALGPELSGAAGDQEGDGAPEGPHSDLGELFGGEEPQSVPERGLTEAFPPSFVDEVEAELEATEAPESSSVEVDSDRQQVPPPPPGEFTDSFTPVAEGESPSEPPPASPEPPEPAPTPLMEPPAAEPPSEPEVVPAAAEPPPGVEPAPVAGSTAQEAEPEPAVEAAPAPEAEVAPQAPVEPEPEREAAAEPPLLDEEMLPPVMPAAPSTPARPPGPSVPGAPPVGVDTVEIPLPPVEPRRPPAAGEPGAPQSADELLSIPGLEPRKRPAPAAGLPETPLPSSAEALRGAAGRSRHLGTWLLIGLLAAALVVAGYLGFGLLEADRSTTEIADAATSAEDAGGAPPEAAAQEADAAPAEAPPSEAAAQEAEAPVAEAEAAAEEAEAPAEERPADEPRADAGPAVAEQAEAAETGSPPAAAEPQAPLTGLDRITWSETDGETALALTADGAMVRDQVELVRLAGSDPRLVIKLSGVSRAFQPATLEVGTEHVRRVRTGLHAGGELHVVVDLADASVSVGEPEVRGSRLEIRLGREGG